MRTPRAATVMLRKVSVWRSTRTPIRTIAIMMIERSNSECRARCPLLDGIAICKSGEEREQRPDRKEHDASNHGHVIARHVLKCRNFDVMGLFAMLASQK